MVIVQIDQNCTQIRNFAFEPSWLSSGSSTETNMPAGSRWTVVSEILFPGDRNIFHER